MSTCLPHPAHICSLLTTPSGSPRFPTRSPTAQLCPGSQLLPGRPRSTEPAGGRRAVLTPLPGPLRAGGRWHQAVSLPCRFSNPPPPSPVLQLRLSAARCPTVRNVLQEREMISVPRENEVSTAVSIKHLILQTAQSCYQQLPCTAHSLSQALGRRLSVPWGRL